MFSHDTVIEASPALIALPAKGEDRPEGLVGVYEFLSKVFAYVPVESFYWFEYFSEAKSWNKTLVDHGNLSADEVASDLFGLVEAGFLVASGSDAFERNQNFKRSWKWDTTSALFHFTVTDNQYGSQDDAIQAQIEKAKMHEAPSLSWASGKGAIGLPAPHNSASASLISLLSRRRTNRTNSGKLVTLEELGSCLFAGLGITGYVETPTGNLPLSMTPSGGARNPYEAFVLAKRCEGLASGIYRYSAAQHSLSPVSASLPNKMSSLVANQEWVDELGVLVVLVGVLERTMWKYPDPNAYRVTLIEAGHIAQNCMVLATRLGLSACPTAAISHSGMSTVLGLAEITHVPIYAFTLGHPKEYQDTVHYNNALGHEAFFQFGFPGTYH